MHTHDTTPTAIGPFEVVRRLGAGGMAETFEGVRRGPGGFMQRVCVKRVLPDLPPRKRTEMYQLFLREARLAASLRHRNLTQVVELGDDRGAPFLALELVQGMDLHSLLRGLPGRQLPIQVATLVALEVAEALAHAHSRGVIHRDVSPQNILLSVDGEVKLTDFGISRALGELPLTRPGVVRGNIWYMAPEVLEEAAPPSALCDIFSLGVVLFESLTGTPAGAIGATSRRPLSLRQVAPNLPEPVLMVVERSIARVPARRFPDAHALADTLAPLTNPSAARRALLGLVRDRMGRVEAPRRPPPAEPDPSPPSRAALPAARPSARQRSAHKSHRAPPAGAAVSPEQKSRWKKYAVAPNVWANARRAAQMSTTGKRHTQHKSDHIRPERTLPKLPSAWWNPARALSLAGFLAAALLGVALVALLFR